MEKLDPNLQKKWESELAKEGLPETPSGKETVVEETGGDILNAEEKMLAKAMEDILREYNALPSEIQQDIIDDIKKRKEVGASFKTISDRLHLLVQKGSELDVMTNEDSDRYYQPQPSLEEIKLKEEIEGRKEIVSRDIDDLLKKLEQIKQKGINKANRRGNSDENKPPKLPPDQIH